MKPGTIARHVIRERAEALLRSMGFDPKRDPVKMFLLVDGLTAVAAEARASAIEECARVLSEFKTTKPENGRVETTVEEIERTTQAFLSLLAPRADVSTKTNESQISNTSTDDGGE